MNLQTIGFDHICVRVKNYELSKKFYTEVLGAACYAEWHHQKGFMACMLRLNGGGVIEMLGNGIDSLPTNVEEISGCYIHLALRVDDVEAAVAKALEYGATSRGNIKDSQIPSPMHIGTVYGPSGEIIEFLKPIK